MVDPKFVTILVGIAFLAAAMNLPQLEGFGGTLPPMTVKRERIAKVQTPTGSAFYTIPGNYQSMLPPRFSNVDYGAYIKYNMPPVGQLAALTSTPFVAEGYAPLGSCDCEGQKVGNAYAGKFAGQKEGYCGASREGYCGAAKESYDILGKQQKDWYCPSSSQVQQLGTQGYAGEIPNQPMKEYYDAGNRNGCSQTAGADAMLSQNNMAAKQSSLWNMANLPTASQADPQYSQQLNMLNYTKPVDMLPAPAQSIPAGGQQQLLNALGQTVQEPAIYDRYIFANQRSRLYAQGDPLRGDLPIVPVQSDWFRPSVHPQIDLRDGSLAVIGGLDNTTSRELLALQNAASGGLLDTGSGVNYAVQKNIYASAAGGDLRVQAFP